MPVLPGEGDYHLRSNKLRSGSRSTRKSMSLWASLSPWATEPKTRTLRGPRPVAIRRISSRRACVLLHAGHLLAAIRAPAGPGGMGRHLDGEIVGGVASDPGIYPALPATRRQGTEPSRHGTLQTDATPAGLGENAGPRATAYYPAWVIPQAARNLLLKQGLTLLSWPLPVNSRRFGGQQSHFIWDRGGTPGWSDRDQTSRCIIYGLKISILVAPLACTRFASEVASGRPRR